MLCLIGVLLQIEALWNSTYCDNKSSVLFFQRKIGRPNVSCVDSNCSIQVLVLLKSKNYLYYFSLSPSSSNSIIIIIVVIINLKSSAHQLQAINLHKKNIVRRIGHVLHTLTNARLTLVSNAFCKVSKNSKIPLMSRLWYPRKRCCKLIPVPWMKFISSLKFIYNKIIQQLDLK